MEFPIVNKDSANTFAEWGGKWHWDLFSEENIWYQMMVVECTLN